MAPWDLSFLIPDALGDPEDLLQRGHTLKGLGDAVMDHVDMVCGGLAEDLFCARPGANQLPQPAGNAKQLEDAGPAGHPGLVAVGATGAVIEQPVRCGG